jgi:hypothetical protein
MIASNRPRPAFKILHPWCSGLSKRHIDDLSCVMIIKRLTGLPVSLFTEDYLPPPLPPLSPPFPAGGAALLCAKAGMDRSGNTAAEATIKGLRVFMTFPLRSQH